MKSDSHFPYHYHIVAVSIISISCVLIYANTLHSPFLFDDLDSILENPHIRLTSLNIQKIYEAGMNSPCSNRPVANISFALNYFFGQYNPRGYHAVNIMIHLINGILVYFLSLCLLNPPHGLTPKPLSPTAAFPIFLMSLFSSLLFIAHPLQTQSVTYIIQRMTSMSAMFFLLSLFLYIHGRSSETMWKRWTLLICCFLSWFMALGSKEVAISLPIIIVLYEWYFFQDLRSDWLRRNWKCCIGLIVVLGLLVLLYLGERPLDRLFNNYAHQDFSVWERVLTQFRVVVFYVSLLFFPHPSRLNLLHHITTSHCLLDPISTLLSLFFIVGLMGLAVYMARKERIISFCILWFFINLALESSIIKLAMIYEHRLYLSMLGFALAVSYLVFRLLWGKWRWAIVISVLVLLPLAAATYTRNRVWQDAVMLWSDVISKNADAFRVHYNLGIALESQGRVEEAITHYQEALRIQPNFAHAHNNLGLALASVGKTNEAITHYYEALRINPEHDEAHNNLGLALASMGKTDEAITHYYEALRINPDSEEGHLNLGVALEKKGRIAEAIEHYSEVLRINPFQAMAYCNLGDAWALLGKTKKALAHYHEALRIDPDCEEAHNNLGVALAKGGRMDRAVYHFQEALRINPEFESAQDNLRKALELQSKKGTRQ